METKTNQKPNENGKNVSVVQNESNHLTVVKPEISQVTIGERLARIADLEKKKAFFNKLNALIADLQDFCFEDANSNQIIKIIDVQGKKFETNYAPTCAEIINVLIAKAKTERANVEEYILNATI